MPNMFRSGTSQSVVPEFSFTSSSRYGLPLDHLLEILSIYETSMNIVLRFVEIVRAKILNSLLKFCVFDEEIGDDATRRSPENI